MKLNNLASGLLGLVAIADAASLTQVTNFGSNPSGARMYIYVPDRLQTNPPILTAVHYCTGTANAYYTGTPYARLADQYGFIVIYPESPYSGSCWDVSSQATLTRDGGGSSTSIAQMVKWAIERYNADRNRIFVAGTSSGAMMTNVLAATYPDLFKAAAAYAGVPAGCFYTGTVAGWNSTCANGQSIASQQVWAQTALNMYPGYTGPRPKMMIYHGSADTTIYPQVSFATSSLTNRKLTPPPELQRDPEAVVRCLRLHLRLSAADPGQHSLGRLHQVRLRREPGGHLRLRSHPQYPHQRRERPELVRRHQGRLQHPDHYRRHQQRAEHHTFYFDSNYHHLLDFCSYPDRLHFPALGPVRRYWLDWLHYLRQPVDLHQAQ